MGNRKNRPQQNKNSEAGFRSARNEEVKTGERLKKWYFAAMIGTGIILEEALKRSWIQGSSIRSVYIGGASGIGGLLLAMSGGIYKKDRRLQKLRRPGYTLWEDIVRKGKVFFNAVLKDTRMCLLILVFCWMTVSVAWAQCHLTSRLLNGGAAFFLNNGPFVQIMAISGEASNAKEVWNEKESAADRSGNGCMEEVKRLAALAAAAMDEITISDTNAEPEAKVEEKARRMKLILPTADWAISEEERKGILFEDGEYMISSNWEPEQAAVKVKACIDSLIRTKRENEFDAFADMALRNEVADASKKDELLVTSTEKDVVIQVRLSAYQTYGKESLARLLAEDFHCYALVYKYYNGDHDEMNSYYLQSLKWQYERLKYRDISGDTQKKILTSIQYRYNDIMTYSEPESEQWKRAKLLSDTFRRIIEGFGEGEE